MTVNGGITAKGRDILAELDALKNGNFIRNMEIVMIQDYAGFKRIVKTGMPLGALG